MEVNDLLRRVAEALERLNVSYFVTGSVASGFHGEPRMTQDIDIVAKLELDCVDALRRAFPEEEFYLSADAMREAIRSKTQFNIIHPSSGLKIDVMVSGMGPFDRSRFSRVRRIHPRADFAANFASPEDVILKKMEYYRDGASEKHLRDITSIFKINGDEVDRGYIQDWAVRLGVSDVWKALARRMDKPK